MIQSLTVQEQLGESILGTASIGPNFSTVEIGRLCPMLRKAEDPEGLVRASFLDPTVPIELNLAHWETIRSRLMNLKTQQAARTEWNDPETLLRSRPSIGYLPPEIVARPNDKGLDSLETLGDAADSIANLRKENSPGKFWSEVARQDLYVPLLREITGISHTFGLDLIAPPVPVISKERKSSPQAQASLNGAAAMAWEDILAPSPVGSSMTLQSFEAREDTGLLYSLHVDPLALKSPSLLDEALATMTAALQKHDNRFWGVHIHFTDIRLASKQGRPSPAKEFVRDAANIAQDSNLFVWVSDVGPAGPVFLDLGAAFASYHSGMTPGRIYQSGGPNDSNLKYGKVLSLWEFNLLTREDIQNRGWEVKDTELRPNAVPPKFRGNKGWKDYRVKFAKPQNIAVAQRVNNERVRELRENGNPKPGHKHVGRSNDGYVAPWAGG